MGGGPVRSRKLIVLTGAVIAVLAAAACGGSKPAAGNVSARYNAALGAVVNPPVRPSGRDDHLPSH
jgi:hypothetical protein